jgi:TetR/AcrR family transcriptional regulator, cholesterol catabolism regulator
MIQGRLAAGRRGAGFVLDNAPGLAYVLGRVTKKKAPDDGGEDALLDAAARLFRRKGFEATTVRDIARAAGMLPGSLHYRYPTKSALLLSLMKRGVARDLASVRAAIAGAEEPLERIRLALRARMRLLASRGDAVYVLLYDWRSLKGRERDEMIELRDHYEAFWQGLLDDAARAGHLRPDLDMKMMRLFVFGAVNWMVQWYSPRGPRTPEQIADAFWNFIALGALDEARELTLTEVTTGGARPELRPGQT